MKSNGCDFIPSSLAACFIKNDEVHILNMSSDGISIRTIEYMDNIEKLNMSFYNFKKSCYEEIEVKDIVIKSVDKTKFYYVYNITIDDQNYVKMVNFIFRDYSRYVTLKNYGEENEFSEVMTGYPAEKDFDFYEFYDDQKREWMKDIDLEGFSNILKNVEISCTINTDELYNKFLKYDIDTFFKYYLEENYFDIDNMFKNKISRIYIGNEFCHNLFPEKNILIQMLSKALHENLNITLCFTYIRECLIEKNKEILEDVYNWCRDNDKRIEIVINDWGMLKLIEDKKDYFDFNLGILLNKRKKDPRYMYKNGLNENRELLSENSLNSSQFTDFLKKYGINRFEFESCGYMIKIPEGKHSLHMPFYLTNMSQYCPLYAMCTKMDRGSQRLVKNCPKYCTDYIFSYPKHLNMVGRYNCLFAFDDTLLRDCENLKYYLKDGIDRIVLNFI